MKEVRPCDMSDKGLVANLLMTTRQAWEQVLRGEAKLRCRVQDYTPERKREVVLRRELMKRLRGRKK